MRRPAWIFALIAAFEGYVSAYSSAHGHLAFAIVFAATAALGVLLVYLAGIDQR